MRKNPVLENEMKRYTRNMKCAWIILGVNLVLALFALIAQMGLSGRENYMTILQYRFPIQCYVLMGYGLFIAICILIPGLAGGSIAGERERKTLDLLLTTHLSPWKIILGKLESSLCLIFLISFSTLPVISTQFQAEHLIKNFSFCREHDDRYIGFVSDLSADLIAVHTGKHQIQEDQVRLKGRKCTQSFLPVVDNLTLKTFFGKIKRYQFGDVVVIVYNHYFLFGYHKNSLL